MVNVRVQQDRMHTRWLPSFFYLAEKLRIPQTPIVILASTLELAWHGKCPLLAHLYVSSPQYSWIKATGDGRTFHVGHCPAAHSGASDILHPWRHGNLGFPHGSGRSRLFLRFRHRKGAWETAGGLHHGCAGWPWAEYGWFFVQLSSPSQGRHCLLLNPIRRVSHWCRWADAVQDGSKGKPPLLWDFSICSLQWHRKFTQT